MHNLEIAYLKMINPHNVVNWFGNNEDFKDWLLLGTKEDIQSCLIVFEYAELYEHCVIIRDLLKSI